MSKQRRQQALLELISEYEIDTQEELTRRLQALGFETTQATVSRDIRELKLEKVSYGSGKHRYAASLEPDTGTHASYQHVMASCILSIEAAQNIIVVKTVSGTDSLSEGAATGFAGKRGLNDVSILPCSSRSSGHACCGYCL